MTDTKTQTSQTGSSKIKIPQKPNEPSKSTPLTTRIESKRVINRLIDFFEAKA